MRDKLSQKLPEKYAFLNCKDIITAAKVSKNEIVELWKLLSVKTPNAEIEDKCLALFESWITGKSNKSSLAYVLLANKDVFYSDEFLTKVIKSSILVVRGVGVTVFMPQFY